MIRVMTAFALLLVLAGCTATKPNYSYTAAASDPVLLFRSDFDFHTWFEVNIDPANNSCQNYKRVGYTLNVSSPLIIGTQVTPEVRAQVPAGQPVTVKAHYSFSSGAGTDSCGPIYVSFTPQPGKTYLVRMAKGGERCTVFVTDTANPNVIFPATGAQPCGK